jgi:hypothetical protein
MNNYSPTALRNTSFIRLCHPGPLCLKRSITSGSMRNLMARLRLRLTGRPLLRRRSSAGGLSGSANASALIDASSTSLISSRFASALRVASFQSGCFLDIGFNLSLVGLTKRNDVANIISHREDNDVQALPDKAGCNFPHFAVVIAVVRRYDRRGKIKFLGLHKVDAALRYVATVLQWIKSEPTRLIHNIIVPPLNRNCEGFLRAGRRRCVEMAA